jgi:hypothetical protein
MGPRAIHETPMPAAEDQRPECFVVMPISEPDGYETGHFAHVYKDVLTPACERAGYRAIRADQIRETNLIHLDVLQRLIASPMVLCDLSSRNPNVLFELGLRQAFDKPVVLVQETDTPKIFDIAPLRFTEYRRALVYHEVLEDQEKIASALLATANAFTANTGVNSIVRILALTRPATLPDVNESSLDPALQLIRAEISQLRSEFSGLIDLALRHNSLARPEALLDSLQLYAHAVRTAAELEREKISLEDLEKLRNKVYDEMSIYHQAAGPPPAAFQRDLSRVDSEYRAILDRVLRKSKRTAG